MCFSFAEVASAQFNKLAVSEPQKPKLAVFASIYVPSDPNEPYLWQCTAPDVNQAGLNRAILSIVPCPAFTTQNLVPLDEVTFSKPLRFKTLIVNRLSHFPVLPMIAKDFESIQLTDLNLCSEQFEAFFTECMQSQSLKKVRLSKTLITKNMRNAFHRRFFQNDLRSVAITECFVRTNDAEEGGREPFAMQPAFVRNAIEHWVEAEEPRLEVLEVSTDGRVEIKQKRVTNVNTDARATLSIYKETFEAKHLARLDFWKIRFALAR
uniref:Leucine-rich repeat domain-containing protein n=1 Tax=Steinernema glaseri TaxID=37863 RepID=A0A1I8A236_9BILA